MSTETMSSSSSDWTLLHSISAEDKSPVAPPDLALTGGRPTTGQLSPKGGFRSKPSRRRSRASRRIPTTLLNANTTNFRALVQQFTGCPSNPFSLRAHKGPVTLDFGGHGHNYYDHHIPPSVIAPVVTYNSYHHQNNDIQQYYYSQPPVTAVVQQQQQLHVHDDHDPQKCMNTSSSISSNHVGHGDVFLGGDMESNIGLSMEDLASLHELLSRDSDFFVSEDLII